MPAVVASRARVGSTVALGRIGAVAAAVVVLLVAFAGSAAAQDDSGIRGTFRNPEQANRPVAGVEVVVRDEGGEVVGRATSAADGTYSLDLPGAGAYTAELQTSSLPMGVRLTDPSKTELSFSLTPGQRKPLLFPFGKDTTVTVTTLDKVPGTLVDGVRLGLIIAMTAIGLSLIYGTTQFTNFAHGEMVTFGAIATWYLNQEAGWPVVWAGLAAVLLCCLAGGLLDAGLWAPLRRRKTGPFSLMVVSFGLSIMFIAVFQFVFGTKNRPYNQYSRQRDAIFTVGNQNVPPRAVWITVLSIVVLGGVGLFLQRARFGKAMRAVADNAPLASASGIDTARVVRWVWVMGSGLAGLGGIFYALDQDVNFQQGQSILLLMFAGITLGGLGTSFGAAAGCFVLGIAIQFSTLWIPTSVKNVGALVALIVVLMFRPQGLFGRRERIG